jgi:mRNA interferase RelE/StbE
VDQQILVLAQNPRPPGCIKLSGPSSLWRIRVGDYRVVYQIQDQQLIVLVVTVAHRRDVYRGM